MQGGLGWASRLRGRISGQHRPDAGFEIRTPQRPRSWINGLRDAVILGVPTQSDELLHVGQTIGLCAHNEMAPAAGHKLALIRWAVREAAAIFNNDRMAKVPGKTTQN